MKMSESKVKRYLKLLKSMRPKDRDLARQEAIKKARKMMRLK